MAALDGRDVVWRPEPRQAVALSCPAFEVLYGGAKGGGKDLCIASRVPTPTGWTTVGDIKVGDVVFAADGTPTRVLYVSEVYTNKRCYELEFSDGTKIVCSEDHPWSVHDFASRRLLEKRTDEFRAKRKTRRSAKTNPVKPWLVAANRMREHVYLPPPEPMTVETREIVANLTVPMGKSMATNYSIENQGQLDLPNAELPIGPYTLGAWLGDGVSAANRIALPLTAGGGKEEVAQEIAGEGYVVRRRDDMEVIVEGLGAHKLGPKHIPAVYLRASMRQRLALLQGLMDTDGCAEADGSCSFSASRKELFDSAVELMRTLGLNPRVTSKIPTYTYLGERREGKRAYQAKFMAPFHVFRLPRKRDRQKTVVQSRYRRRFIVAAREVTSVPTKCIGIEHESHLYLAGDQFIPTHNTDFLVMAHAQQLQLCHQKWLATRRRQRGRYVIFRKNLKNLTDIIQRAEELYPVLDPGAHYDRQEKYWKFSCGYRVDFAHLDGPSDHIGWNGQELSLLGIDQAEEIAREVYLFLFMQVRTKDDDMRPLLGVRLTANPGGPHAAWLKEVFITGCKPHNTIHRTQVPIKGGRTIETTRAFIPAKLDDNKYLSDDGRYEANLMSLPEHLRQMYREGNWDVVFGAFFAHLLKPEVHFIRSFPIPGGWPVKFGLDWGLTAPSSVHWGARNPATGDVYIIDELYKPGRTGRTLGEAMQNKLSLQKWSNEKKWTVKDMYGLIDRQAMAKTGSDGAGPSTPAAGIQSWGWRIFPANKDRTAGMEQVSERLLPKANGKPSLYIFSDRCPKLVQTLPTLMPHPHDPEDIDYDNGEDHAYDSLRYLLMDWPIQGSRVKKQEGDQDVERWLAIARARQTKVEDGLMTTGYGD